jgi:hypothetical protein
MVCSLAALAKGDRANSDVEQLQDPAIHDGHHISRTFRTIRRSINTEVPIQEHGK